MERGGIDDGYYDVHEVMRGIIREHHDDVDAWRAEDPVNRANAWPPPPELSPEQEQDVADFITAAESGDEDAVDRVIERMQAHGSEADAT